MKIGDTFKTPKDGVLTIKEFDKDSKRYIFHCSKCSCDKTLWPYGSISSSRSPSVRYGFPCGCTRVSFSKEQFSILLDRRSLKRDLQFKGFAEPFHGLTTKIETLCENNHTSYSTDIRRYLYEVHKCKTCSLESGGIFLPHKWVGKTTKTPQGGLLTIIDNKGADVYSTCDICSKDKELFPIPFKQCKSDWAKKIPCGCSSSIKWSADQWEVLCKRKSASVGNVFLGFSEKYRGCYTHIKQSCGKDKSHPDWATSTIDKLIYSSRGCPSCAKEGSSFGLYEDRVEEEDNLYLILFTSFDKRESFIKIGRTFDMKQRTQDYLKYYNIEIIKVVKDTHFNVRSLEKHIHKTLHTFHYRPIVYFGGSVLECFKMEALKEPIIKSTFSQ